MASKEMAIFHKTQWDEGSFYGSQSTDNNRLTNKLRVLNEDSFNEPVETSWSAVNLLEDYSDITINENKINLKVLKESAEKSIGGTEFSVVESGFQKNGIPKELDYLLIKFDWRALKTNFEENAVIELSDGSASAHSVILTNKSEIKLFSDDGNIQNEESVVDSSGDSIGSIASYITNELNEWYAEFRLDYDSIEEKYYIETRLKSAGYESIWYRNLFGTSKISNIKFAQKANLNTSSIVDKELNIKEIYAEGFESGYSYESKVFDGGENETVWENFTLNGSFPENSLISDGSNSISVKLYASNNRETLKNDYLREYTLIPTENEFNILTELEDNGESFKGRFMSFELSISDSKNYQNSIDYFKVEYLEPRSLSDYVPQEITEATASSLIGPAGGILSLETEYYPLNLYIPQGALTADETITVRRVPSSENAFADDIIGFEFGPEGLEFLKPVMIEVDYSGFNFSYYQSEEGLKIAYLDNQEPEELSTVIDSGRKKAISYLEHFSSYGIMATENLYSPRTKIATLKMPRWMKVRDKDSNFQKLLNHGFFREADLAGSKYYDVVRNYFLELADTKIKYIAFKTKIENFSDGIDSPLITDTERFVAKYKGKYIPITFSESNFYNSKKELSYLNLKTGVIYFLNNYKTGLKIIDKYQEKEYLFLDELVDHKIWNVFDEFALLFDMERNKREDNESLKLRILDYGLNPGDSTELGLKNHIARELALDKEDVKVNSLSSENYLDELKNADGSASDRLLSIATYINNHLNIYWDQWVWDEGYWEIEEGSYQFIY